MFPRFLLRSAPLLLLAAVLPAQDTARLANLSTRAVAGTGSAVLTAGFVVAPGASQRVLVRAAGPALSSFGLAGTLADPVLTLLDSSGGVLATNDNWLAADAAAMSTAGAFAFTSGSRDAALVTTLPPGSYTAQVTGSGGTSGLALVEIYELAATGARLVNLSTRAQVGTGANVVIPGIVVSPGSGQRRLLVRAAGPALASFGLTGVLADPTLSLTDAGGTTVLAANDDWGVPAGLGAASATTLANAFSVAGAFAFPAGGKDSAALVTLSPGAYTLQISGTSGGSGLALVEVYDVTGLEISSAAVAPALLASPASVSVSAGGSATFTVSANGSAPLAYQWYKGSVGSGTAIAGATAASFALSGITAADAGSYYAVVSNSAGSVASAAAVLNVANSAAGANTAAVVAAANAFVATLGSAQQTAVQLSWSLANVRRWSNLPAQLSARNGVNLGTLSAAQRAAADTLVAAALGSAGTTLWKGMLAADDYLNSIGGGSGYGNGHYYIALYGTPSASSFWVLQLTGHHLTYNLSYNGTYASGTPLFLGVEPKASFTVGGVTYDPMSAQRAAAADLFSALASVAGAQLTGTYSDILFGANGQGGIDGTYPKSYPTGTAGRGVLAGTLPAADREKVRAFVRAYVDTQAADVAAPLLAAYLDDTAFASTYVAYAGTPGISTRNSYLRVDGPRAWIEFSVQNGVIINNDIHYHTIWRDKSGDFGGQFSTP